ncbi:branched-chain amino acid ABC transporter ATP-binding protein [Frankia sp. R43]|uniref:ABC transporter ATP-binding protein n=1 Tax=Frankia sp. R43 TaxID=269536 RepID=UPI0006CA16BD|nr:ABC transporter ATP-binding protein [Frankia sp. R43]KPM52119.1 branched-chain amino acid ABC transporter ATP-binding protein [Frankia sp. R43]
MTAALAVTGLSAGYGSAPVIRGISFEVLPGEIVALLGRNGAGKTTTLLTISGLVRARAGEVSVGGKVVAAHQPRAVTRAGVGHVPEERALFANLSVRDNLAVAGARRARDLRRVLELFPELERLLDRRSGLLSGGEQQMLALARAVYQRPKVLLVDEMSLGLAPKICQRLVGILRRLATEQGLAVVLVEQHLFLALEAADRAYVLHRGEITLSGTRAELAERRAELEAAYLGSVSAGATAA